MSWMVPVAKQAAKYGVKYGPHAKLAWQAGGEHVTKAARAKVDEVARRRQAFDEASTTREGSVLRVVHRGEATFVVFSGDEPVSSYPPVATPLPDVVGRGDLSQRMTPAQRREQQVRRRVANRAARLRGRDGS